MKRRTTKRRVYVRVLGLCVASLLSGCSDSRPRAIVDESDIKAIREYELNMKQSVEQMEEEDVEQFPVE